MKSVVTTTSKKFKKNRINTDNRPRTQQWLHTPLSKGSTLNSAKDQHSTKTTQSTQHKLNTLYTLKSSSKLQSNLEFKQQKSGPMYTSSGVDFCCLKPRFDCTTVNPKNKNKQTKNNLDRRLTIIIGFGVVYLQVTIQLTATTVYSIHKITNIAK